MPRPRKPFDTHDSWDDHPESSFDPLATPESPDRPLFFPKWDPDEDELAGWDKSNLTETSRALDQNRMWDEHFKEYDERADRASEGRGSLDVWWAKKSRDTMTALGSYDTADPEIYDPHEQNSRFRGKLVWVPDDPDSDLSEGEGPGRWVVRTWFTPKNPRQKEIFDLANGRVVQTDNSDKALAQLEQAAQKGQKVSLRGRFFEGRMYGRNRQYDAEAEMWGKGYDAAALHDRVMNPRPGDPHAPGDLQGFVDSRAAQDSRFEEARGFRGGTWRFWS